MIRTLKAISLALHFVAPHFQPHRAAVIELLKLGAQHDIDPFTIIAVVERESGWDPQVIGKLGEVGLGQVMPKNYVPCSEDRFSPECLVIIEQLQDWRFNLNETAALMEAHRVYCGLAVRSWLAVFWLQEYQGYAGTCGFRKDRRGRWSNVPVPSGTLQVLARRRELARRFG